MLLGRMDGGETSVAGADLSEREPAVQGCATDDVLTDNGRVHDTDRTMFLQAYLTQLQHTNPDGCRCGAISSGARWTTVSVPTASAIVSWFVYVGFSRKTTAELSAARFRDAAVRNAVA
jgi:hypothetical protein